MAERGDFQLTGDEDLTATDLSSDRRARITATTIDGDGYRRRTREDLFQFNRTVPWRIPFNSLSAELGASFSLNF